MIDYIDKSTFFNFFMQIYLQIVFGKAIDFSYSDKREKISVF